MARSKRKQPSNDSDHATDSDFVITENEESYDEQDESYDESDDQSSNQKSKQSNKQSTKQSTKPPASQSDNESDDQSGSHKPHACPHDGCNKRYAKIGKLNRHMAIHTGVRSHSCSHCGQSFFRADHRNMHEKRKHSGISDSDKPFKCTFADCTASFFSSSHLRRHLASSVHRVKALPCTIDSCTESFVKKSQLKSHIASAHPELIELAFKCSFAPCAEAFSTRASLTKHVNLHHSVKRYICSDCGEEFTRFLVWRQHCKTHSSTTQTAQAAAVEPTPPRAFACTHPGCTKSYSSQWNLNNHVQIVHSGTRAFVCPHCQQDFAYKSNLKKHIQREHELVVTDDAESSDEPVLASRMSVKDLFLGRVAGASAKERALGAAETSADAQSEVVDSVSSEQSIAHEAESTDTASEEKSQTAVEASAECKMSDESQTVADASAVVSLDAATQGVKPAADKASSDEPEAKRMRMSPPLDENQSAPVEVM